jgi:cobalamin-dependent methionine synthase I
MKLPPLTASTVIKNMEKIKQSLQHATTICGVMQVSYSRSKLLQKKNGEIIVIMGG